MSTRRCGCELECRGVGRSSFLAIGPPPDGRRAMGQRPFRALPGSGCPILGRFLQFGLRWRLWAIRAGSPGSRQGPNDRSGGDSNST
eukprot:11361040-Alexandrium_andersonii.AAC.1